VKFQKPIQGVNEVLPAGKTVVGHWDVCTFECEWGCLMSCDSYCTEACGGYAEMLSSMDNDAYYGQSGHIHRFQVFPSAPSQNSIV
jgi:hypothetical protein